MNPLDIIFPKKCALCMETLSGDNNFLCEKCEKDLPVMKHICAIENLPVYNDKTLSVYCALRYTGTVKKGIVSMKYGERPQVAEFLGYMTYEVLSQSDIFDYEFSDFDYVVPVPATKEKIKMRGYNQAKLIADSFGEMAGIEVLDNVIIKNSNVESQSLLDLAARQKSVAGIYEPGDVEKIKGKNLILADDILTTGATVIECAKILYKAGAGLVVAVTASTGKKDI